MHKDNNNLQSVINYTARLASLVAPNALKFSGKTVQFIGTGPFSIDDMKGLLPLDVTVVVADQRSRRQLREPDFVVIGVEDFDEELISKAVDMRGDETSFMPQDGFLDLVLFGYNWWTDLHDYLNESKDWHPGMRYLHSLQSFRWPSTTAPESDQSVVSDGDFKQQSDLFEMGYQITGKSKSRRWSVLTRAVPELGLKAVVETIANHIRVRKAQVGGADRYSHAINEWEYDLSMLRATYYRGSRADFQWPSTDG